VWSGQSLSPIFFGARLREQALTSLPTFPFPLDLITKLMRRKASQRRPRGRDVVERAACRRVNNQYETGPRGRQDTRPLSRWLASAWAVRVKDAVAKRTEALIAYQ